MILFVKKENTAIAVFKLLTISSIFFTCTTPSKNIETFDQPYILTVQVNQYVRLRSHFTSPYLKFQNTNSRLNVCGLPRYEKLHLCKTHLAGPRHDFTITGRTYPNLGCHRIQVELDNGSEAHIPAFKCPTPFRSKIYDGARFLLHSSIAYYLSGGWIDVFMVAYYRHYGPAAKVKPEISFEQGGRPNFKRFARYRRKEQYSTSASSNPLMYHDVAPYRLEEKSPKRHRSPEYAENLTKNFVESVKLKKSPYSKFRRSYRIINVCGLLLNHRIQLCKKAFDGDEYDYYADEQEPETLSCEQLETSFNYVEFKPSQLRVFICGESEFEGTVRKSYYISAGVLQKSILGHIRYHPEVEIIPDVVVKNVDFGVLKDGSSAEKASKKMRIEKKSEKFPKVF